MWSNFEMFAIVCVVSWIIAIAFSVLSFHAKKWELPASISSLLGIAALLLFIVNMWIGLERPPLRTLGETRLWYSFFLAAIGFVIYKKWNMPLIHIYALSMAILFMLINFFRPEIHSKTLMPALQSVWFVPHVIVYMIAYAILGLTSLFGFIGIYKMKTNTYEQTIIEKADNLVYIGFGFLTLGLLFGALWAKEAWGHYWTWDPKETWAFLTWAVYLIYIHYRIHKPKHEKQMLYILLFSFVILLICWFGINYLPAAQSSVHVYSS